MKATDFHDTKNNTQHKRIKNTNPVYTKITFHRKEISQLWTVTF